MAAGDLPQVVLPDIVIERPARPEHGDYACNLPLRLSRAARANPLDIARTISTRIPKNDALASIVASPTKPVIITVISQAASTGNSAMGINPANTPTNVAAPFPPRKPYHTGYT